ncbi:MAG: dihydrofolate reductase family protein [Planctomycetales bacterium]|nr:dihydrofolate reductase family protein [Planctomycetales bacterium]
MNSIDASQVCQSDIIGCVRRCVEQAHQENGRRQRPFVTVTYAQSLDGSIAHAEGETLKLSNDLSLRLTHQVRALHDGILVGINTVVRDNPQLNVRLVEGENPQPIIVDGSLRFPIDARLLKDPCVRPIICTSHDACTRKEQQLLNAGANIVRVTQTNAGLLDLHQVFAHLKQQGLRTIMVEGGATIITSLLTQGLADQYLVTISPRLVGGLRSIHPQVGGQQERLAHLHNLQYQWLGTDLILRGDVLPRVHKQSSEQSGVTANAEVASESATSATVARQNGSLQR